MYAIIYHTATHTAADGPYETLDEAKRAYDEKFDWYERRSGKVVEGDPGDPKLADENECLYPQE